MKNILDGIRIDQVKPIVDINFPDNVTTAAINTFNGLTAIVTSAVLEETSYSTFKFQYAEPSSTENEKSSTEETEKEKLDVKKQVANLNEKTSG